MFPVVLDLRSRLAVVVGGGPVGRRKANALRAAGASVRIVCLEPKPGEEKWAAVDWRTEPYRATHLEGAALAFAAGPADLNRRIVADAKANGVWVNSATDPTSGDFYSPAVVRRGDFLLAVSTSGAAPALTRSIRDRLEKQFDEAYGAWVSLLAELRPAVLHGIPNEKERQSVWENLCREEWAEKLRQEPLEQVLLEMLRQIGLRGLGG